jgi:hypothetical protein
MAPNVGTAPEAGLAPIFVLLLVFLGIGLLARQYNAWTRLLLGAVIACAVVLLYLL